MPTTNLTKMRERATAALELAGKATEGPWTWEVEWQGVNIISRRIMSKNSWVMNLIGAGVHPDNIALITKSRTTVPALAQDNLELIEEVERLNSGAKRRCPGNCYAVGGAGNCCSWCGGIEEEEEYE